MLYGSPARDAGFDLEIGQGFAEPIAVAAFVGDQHVGLGKGGQHGRRTFAVADLPFGEQQDQRFAVAVANRMQLRVQAALGSSDTAGNSPF